EPVQGDPEDALAGALGRPTVAAAQVPVRVADEVVEDGRGLGRVLDGAQGAVAGAVAQDALDRLGEDRARADGLALLVEDPPARGLAERGHQAEVRVAHVAQRLERLLEALAGTAWGCHRGPHGAAV